MNPDLLVRLREARAWTQHETADRIGISQRQYARWEKGQATPGPQSLRRIAQTFGVDVGELRDVPTDSTLDKLAELEQRLDRIERRLGL